MNKYGRYLSFHFTACPSLRLAPTHLFAINLVFLSPPKHVGRFQLSWQSVFAKYLRMYFKSSCCLSRFHCFCNLISIILFIYDLLCKFFSYTMVETNGRSSDSTNLASNAAFAAIYCVRLVASRSKHMLAIF